jgi:hypothetical protein
MAWTHAHSIKVFERPDGKAKIYILKRDDGLYEYRGEAEFNEDGEIYWAPKEHSGLHETAEHAEHTAFNEVPWLRSMTGGEI